MSTQITSVAGKKELVMGNHSEYIDATAHITRFYGGKDRGVCIQFTIETEFSVSHIQITKELAKELANKIIQSLSEYE